MAGASAIFIMPPSLAELEKRLAGRGTDTPEVIERRLDNAVRELAEREIYDHLVVNDRLEQAVEMVKAVILAARSRVRRDRDGRTLTGTFPNGSSERPWITTANC